MDCRKTGMLIRSLRKERMLTQQELAITINVSDKAISKWERGLGCPDVSLLPHLAIALGVTLETLLSGELGKTDETGENMKKMKFFVCPSCLGLSTSTSESSISCCGKIIEPLSVSESPFDERLLVEEIEDEYYVTSSHPMVKNHYISFIAVLSPDSVLIKKMYPEWNMETRIPRLSRGRLLWFCTEHGLYSQDM